MLLAKGTRVRFRRNKEEGIVTALLDNGMVNVYLEETDMEIPVYPSELEHVETNNPPGVRTVPGKQKKKSPKAPPVDIETQYTILKSWGIQLAFDPIQDEEGLTDHFQIYLINDTTAEVLFSLNLYVDGRPISEKHDRLPPMRFLPVERLDYDRLNEGVEFELQCWKILENGSGPRLHKRQRIKPKQFFNKKKTAPLLNRPVYWYRVFESLEPKHKPGTSEDLHVYTKKNLQPGHKLPKDRFYNLHDVQEFANFSTEIDLHIDRLVSNTKKLTPQDIVTTQMRHFEHYMEQAIRLGVERVFLIHGVGTGALKERIHQALQEMPEVRDFKNEFHPKYAFGATEVIL